MNLSIEVGFISILISVNKLIAKEIELNGFGVDVFQDS